MRGAYAPPAQVAFSAHSAAAAAAAAETDASGSRPRAVPPSSAATARRGRLPGGGAHGLCRDRRGRLFLLFRRLRPRLLAPRLPARRRPVRGRGRLGDGRLECGRAAGLLVGHLQRQDAARVRVRQHARPREPALQLPLLRHPLPAVVPLRAGRVGGRPRGALAARRDGRPPADARLCPADPPACPGVPRRAVVARRLPGRAPRGPARRAGRAPRGRQGRERGLGVPVRGPGLLPVRLLELLALVRIPLRDEQPAARRGLGFGRAAVWPGGFLARVVNKSRPFAIIVLGRIGFRA